MDILEFTDAAAWEAWLEEHHADRGEAWLRIGKKHSPIEAVRIGEALESALCFGWIDGRRKALDADSFLQRYCPRRPGSTWSKINTAKIDALAAAGRMRPAGLAEVAAAEADGRWAAAYEPQRTAKVPPDLAAALAVKPGAEAAFDRLRRGERYALMLSLLKIKTPRARSAAVDRIVGRLAPKLRRGPGPSSPERCSGGDGPGGANCRRQSGPGSWAGRRRPSCAREVSRRRWRP